MPSTLYAMILSPFQETKEPGKPNKIFLTLQMVCNYEFRITSVCANWPGSVHDSRIWRESALCTQFESGEHNGLLLGDAGYPCRRFLMTPFLNPTTEAQQKYNSSLCRTRVLVEQSFGILKRRFACLQGILRTNPDQAAAYVIACVVLHNIGIDRGDIMYHRQDVDATPYNPTDHHVAFNGAEGSHMRDFIAQKYFG